MAEDPSKEQRKKKKKSRILTALAIGGASLLAAGVAIFAAPAVVVAIGFGTGGIVAGSTAASMMSAAAIANGGGVAAGSLVATLSSVGAAGLSSAGALAVGGTAAATTAAVGSTAAMIHEKVSQNKEKKRRKAEEENDERSRMTSEDASSSSSLASFLGDSIEVHLLDADSEPLTLRRADQSLTPSQWALIGTSATFDVGAHVIPLLSALPAPSSTAANMEQLYRLVFRSQDELLKFLEGQIWLTETRDGFQTTALSDRKGFVGTAAIEPVTHNGSSSSNSPASASGLRPFSLLGTACSIGSSVLRQVQLHQLKQLTDAVLDKLDGAPLIKLQSLLETCHNRSLDLHMLGCQLSPADMKVAEIRHQLLNKANLLEMACAEAIATAVALLHDHRDSLDRCDDAPSFDRWVHKSKVLFNFYLLAKKLAVFERALQSNIYARCPGMEKLQVEFESKCHSAFGNILALDAYGRHFSDLLAAKTKARATDVSNRFNALFGSKNLCEIAKQFESWVFGFSREIKRLHDQYKDSPSIVAALMGDIAAEEVYVRVDPKTKKCCFAFVHDPSGKRGQ